MHGYTIPTCLYNICLSIQYIHDYTIYYIWLCDIYMVVQYAHGRVLRCFRDPIRAPRMREIRSLQFRTRYLTFSLKTCT